MTKVRDLHNKWMQDPQYQDAFEALAPAFAFAQELIQARTEAGLTQKQVAARRKSGRNKPSTSSLEPAEGIP